MNGDQKSSSDAPDWVPRNPAEGEAMSDSLEDEETTNSREKPDWAKDLPDPKKPK